MAPSPRIPPSTPSVSSLTLSSLRRASWSRRAILTNIWSLAREFSSFSAATAILSGTEKFVLSGDDQRRILDTVLSRLVGSHAIWFSQPSARTFCTVQREWSSRQVASTPTSDELQSMSQLFDVERRERTVDDHPHADVPHAAAL